jgi:Mce-associated membrane protein
VTTLRDNTEGDVSVSPDIEPIAEDETAQEESNVTEEATATEGEAKRERRPISWSGVFAYGVLPGLALLVALSAGYFKWLDDSGRDVVVARTESVRVASEDVVALLSYQPDSADRDLNAARERLTGEFKEAYSHLIREVVIPGAKEKHISSVVKVNAAGSVSATANHALVLLYANQTVQVGEGAPTDTQPVLQLTLDKVNGRWLVSHLDPV